MSFTRAKPAGYVDDVDVVTAAELNQIDTNQSRAIDGNAGGTYTSSGAIALNGSAGFSVGASNPMTVNGTLALAGATTCTGRISLSGNDAGFGLRVYAAGDAPETIQGARYDVVLVPATLTGDRTYTISATTPVPVTGHMLRIARSSEDMVNTAPSAHEATIAWGGSANFQMQDSKWAFVHLLWSGSEWVPIAWSPTSIDVGGTIADSWA